jgi:hypothetical protein
MRGRRTSLVEGKTKCNVSHKRVSELSKKGGKLVEREGKGDANETTRTSELYVCQQSEWMEKLHRGAKSTNCEQDSKMGWHVSSWSFV